MNLLNGDLADGHAVVGRPGASFPVSSRVSAQVNGSAGKPLIFGIRPEDISIESGGPGEATVHDIEDHGVEKILTLHAGETMIKATATAREHVRLEEVVRFGWDADKVVLFDRASGRNLAVR